MRSELTATQQAEHLAKRKELWAAKESGTSGPTLTGRGNKQFAAETAEATGVSKRMVNKATARDLGDADCTTKEPYALPCNLAKRAAPLSCTAARRV